MKAVAALHQAGESDQCQHWYSLPIRLSWQQRPVAIFCKSVRRPGDVEDIRLGLALTIMAIRFPDMFQHSWNMKLRLIAASIRKPQHIMRVCAGWCRLLQPAHSRYWKQPLHHASLDDAWNARIKARLGKVRT